LAVEEEDQAQVLEFCNNYLPGCQVMLVAGTNVTVSAPRSITRIMPDFFEQLEKQVKPVTKKIKEYAIMNSTLEEVFMAVASTDKALIERSDPNSRNSNNQGLTLGGGSAGSRICMICCRYESTAVKLYTRGGI
jgi:hypothetical protein